MTTFLIQFQSSQVNGQVTQSEGMVSALAAHREGRGFEPGCRLPCHPTVEQEKEGRPVLTSEPCFCAVLATGSGFQQKASTPAVLCCLVSNPTLCLAPQSCCLPVQQWLLNYRAVVTRYCIVASKVAFKLLYSS